MADGARVVRLGAAPGRTGEELGLLRAEGEEPRVVRIVWMDGVPEGARVALRREIARAAEALHHPNIQPPLSLEDLDGRLAMLVESADGETLAEILAVGGRLPPSIAARLVRDACTAVHFAHEEGQDDALHIHGWLRPDSLLVSRSGVTLVSGFGAGHARAAADLVPWQSPEQILGGPRVASRASDVYCLGLVLHAALAGENPFAREPDPDVAILSRPAPPLEPLGVPPGLAAVVRRALMVKGADRYGSAGELGRAIDESGVELAAPAAVAAFTDALFPAGMGIRALRQRAAEAGRAALRSEAAARAGEGSDAVVRAPVARPEAAAPAPAANGAPREAPPAAEDAPAPGPELQGDLFTGRFEFVAPPFLPPPRTPPPAPDRAALDPLPPTPPLPPVPSGGRSSGDRAPREAEARGRPALARAAPWVVLVAIAGGGAGWWLSGATRPPEGERAHPGTGTGPVAALSAPTPGAASPPSAALPTGAGAVPSPRSALVASPVASAASPALVPDQPVLDVVSSTPGEVIVDGRRAGRVPISRPVRGGRHEVRLVNKTLGIDVSRLVEVRAPRTELRIEVGKGRLTVAAPQGADIFLDGKLVGATQVRGLEIWEGRHQLLVTLGKAQNEHDFVVGRDETYEYEVTAQVR